MMKGSETVREEKRDFRVEYKILVSPVTLRTVQTF